ncbi:BTAD domain-containing putative transcriptional regulator [Nonomuraea sp. NPDC048881]|uniref:AfsR/SARP family transcriptional regulator n=1 Tax=Nonomuraea sp. NPDC048881 TaxID=3155030 RepID=UPI0033E1CD13
MVTDDQLRSIPNGRQRALLAALLVNPGFEVSYDELVDCVWSEDPPHRPRASLSVYVMRLRRSLGDPEGRRLVTGGNGYALHVNRGTVDMHRFHDLIAEAVDDADPFEQRRLLLQALRLWRGDPLVDIPSPRLQRSICPVLEEQRLLAVDRLITHDLNSGHHSEVIYQLRDLIGRFPHMEKLWGQLIRALYSGGRRAEALITYQEAHRRFLDELGLPPGRELQRLAEQIEQEDPALLTTDLSPPPLRRVPVCREKEVVRLAEALTAPGRSGPMLALYGMPGIGKTSLARQVAASVAEEYPDGRILLDLHGHTSGREPLGEHEALGVLLAAADVAIDAIPEATTARADLWREVMASRRVVLILDDAWTARQVRSLLPNSGTCAVIITSRGLLPLVTDHAVRLEPLAFDESVALFRSLSASAEEGALLDLVTACAGLPLAIAIAAEAVRQGGPPSAVSERLRTGGLAEWSIEGHSLRDAFAASAQRLGGDALQAFLALGRLPERFVSGAELAEVTEIGLRRIEPAVEELIGAGLLDEIKPGLFHMHPLLRKCAQEQGYSAV